MSGRTEGCDGEKKTVVVEMTMDPPQGDPMPECKPDENPELIKATRMSVAMSEIAAGVGLLKSQGVSPEAALNVAKEVWDKVTNHDILALGMATLDGAMPKMEYQVPKGGRGQFTRKASHPGLEEALGLHPLGGQFQKQRLDPMMAEAQMQAQRLDFDAAQEKAFGCKPFAGARPVGDAGHVEVRRACDMRQGMMNAIRMAGVTADDLDALAYGYRQVERYKQATLNEVFGRLFPRDDVVPAADLDALLADGWRIDPEFSAGDGACGVPPHGWSFSFSTNIAHRLVRGPTDGHKFVEGPTHVLVHLAGLLFVSQDADESRTFKKLGKAAWEQAIFQGLKAFADDREFFRSLHSDRKLGRIRLSEARYEFARILVELRMMKPENRETYLSPELGDALAADPFGQIIKSVYEGPMSSG